MRGLRMSRAMGLTSDNRTNPQLHLSPSDLSELIVSIGGVKFWIVSVAPLYIGWVLAQPVALRHLFVDDLRVVLGIIVVGPLLGTFTLLLNVYHDMGTTDRVNPRKKYVQVVEELIGEGLMERDTLLLAAFGFAAMPRPRRVRLGESRPIQPWRRRRPVHISRRDARVPRADNPDHRARLRVLRSRHSLERRCRDGPPHEHGRVWGPLPALGLGAHPAHRICALVVHRDNRPVPGRSLRADDRFGLRGRPRLRNPHDGRAIRRESHPADRLRPPGPLGRVALFGLGSPIVAVRRTRVRRDGGLVALPRVAGPVLRGLHSTADGRPHLGAAPAPLDSPSARRDPHALAIRRTTHLVSLIP